VTRSFIAGGAGFIGSHLTRALLRRPDQAVVVYDNLVSGSEAHLEGVLDDPRLRLIVADLQQLDSVVEEMAGADHVYLFAANPDIAAAVHDPGIDFWQGTYLTHNVIEAVRINKVPRITYASGSGVYGDRGVEEVDEEFGPLIPLSTYGASKLACESMLAAYSHMFGIDTVVFRFANVVGPGQTHGVTYDFVRHLLDDPTRLLIMGDGSQSKWRTPWIAGWDSLRVMFLYAPDFFLLRPGAVLLAAGLALSAALAPGPFLALGIGFDLHWMLLAIVLATVGYSAVQLALLARVFYDFDERLTDRILEVVTYNRGVAASGLLILAGIIPNLVLLIRWLSNNFHLPAIQYSSVFGLLLLILGFQTFGFTLLLHMMGRRSRLQRSP
jgi:nucleoside-diphosphate-sugar epimerase